MKRMILLAFSVSLLCVLGFQHHQVNALRIENENLAQAAKESEQLRKDSETLSTLSIPQDASAEIARLREENRDLLRLRNEVRQLRERKPEFDRLRDEHERLRVLAKTNVASSARGAMQPISIAKEDFCNQGFLTPEATVQTFFWARREHNLQRLSDCLLPERWKTIREGVIEGDHFRPYLVEQFARTEGIEILARRDLANDTVQLGVQIRMHEVPGRKVALTLKLIGSEWKLDLNELW